MKLTVLIRTNDALTKELISDGFEPIRCTIEGNIDGCFDAVAIPTTLGRLSSILDSVVFHELGDDIMIVNPKDQTVYYIDATKPMQIPNWSENDGKFCRISRQEATSGHDSIIHFHEANIFYTVKQ